MKKIIPFYSLFVVSFVLLISRGTALAALVPSMSLTPVTGSDNVQVTVFGADPNVSVLLYHPTATAVSSTNIGTTNGSGYLSTSVSSNSYSIPAQAPVYVIVDGQESASATWPNYTSGGSTISLNPSSVSLTPGQSSIVTAATSASLSVSSNSNPSIAGVSISGNQISVNASNIGTTNVSICAANIGCGTIAVTVQSSDAGSSPALNPSSVSVNVGQSQSVSITGSGTYTISNNSNPAVASAFINGSAMTVNGIMTGSTIVGVCTSSGSNSSCSSENVTVVPASNVSPSLTSSPAVTFSQNQVTLAIGQKQTVTINGTGTYFMSNNSAPNLVSIDINGSNLNLTGFAFGGTNITICQIAGGCGNIYVYVEPNTVPTAASLQAPAVSSFTVSSTNGSFSGAGNTFVVSFSTTQAVNSPIVNVAGSNVPVSGSGSGPYTASYILTGNEAKQIPIAINFSSSSGSAGQAYFYLGDSSAIGTPNTGQTAAVIDALPVATVPAGAASAIFSQNLSVGSTGADVTALQQRLKTLRMYSGPITGKFGYLTQVAVKKYQAKHGLSQIGVVGPATRKFLNQGM
jgi:hypothetical protein